MADPFIGQIIQFGGNFAPRSWAFCDGQLLPIAQNQALFAILGTIYGGDGRVTFALPDMRGRVAIHAGNGPGLSPRTLGQRGGLEANTLSANQLPAHNHPALAQTGPGNTNMAAGNYWSKDAGSYTATYNSAQNSAMAAGAIGNNNTSNSAVNNLQPHLAINWIIALQGIFPSRN